MQVARSHIIVLLRLTFAAHIVAMNFLLRAKSADSTIADSPCTTVTSKIDFFFALFRGGEFELRARWYSARFAVLFRDGGCFGTLWCSCPQHCPSGNGPVTVIPRSRHPPPETAKLRERFILLFIVTSSCSVIKDVPHSLFQLNKM